MRPKVNQIGPFRTRGEMLGKGGWAVVFAAARPGGGPVALKIPYSDLEEDDLAMFSREFALHQQISHDHIVRMYENSTAKDMTYAALELMPGGTLDQLMSRRRIRTGETITILSQIGSALNHMHASSFEYEGEIIQGIVHRDLTPQNIFLDGKGGVKLGDLGLARPVSTYKATTHRIGTPPYMAPEQLCRLRDERGQPVRLSASCDVWQFACLTYELLFQQLPFGPFNSTEDVNVVLNRIQQEPPAFPQGGYRISNRLWGLLTAAMDKNPSSRPTILEFSSTIEKELGREGTPLPLSATKCLTKKKRGRIRSLLNQDDRRAELVCYLLSAFFVLFLGIILYAALS